MSPTSGPGAWDARYAEAAARSDSVWSLQPNIHVAELLADAPPGTAVKDRS